MLKVGATILFFLMTVSAQAQRTTPDGDYYIRALDPSGQFTGIHEILTQPEDGYYKAVYCDTPFWVRLNTVKWTEQESQAGRRLVIVNDKNSGREVICLNPERYVSLDNLDRENRNKQKFAKDAEAIDTKSSRLRTISEAFKEFK